MLEILDPGQEAGTEHLHPHTRRGLAWADASWELYERSGYFGLSAKIPAHFSRLRSSFRRVSRKLDAAPELGCQVTWPSERGLEATISMLRVFSRTFMVYQVARRRDGPTRSGRAMLREINLHAFEHAEAAGAEWFLIYVQDDGARWSRLAYRDFAADHEGRGACVLPFRALEGRSSPMNPIIPNGLSLSEPTKEERALLHRHLVAEKPKPYVDSLDYSDASLGGGLTPLGRAYQAHGLRRDRTLRVLRHHHRPLAMSVMETADEGLHLFGLLDTLRLYPLSSDARPYLDLLVQEARRYFFERGKQSYVYLAEGTLLEGRPGGDLFSDLGGASFIAFSRALLPRFYETLRKITAPRSAP